MLEQLTLFPDASTAVQVIVVIPFGNIAFANVVLLGAPTRLCVKITPEQLSVAVASSSLPKTV
ncbi:hypothetical protein D3C78_883200 [compost metagenome]